MSYPEFRYWIAYAQINPFGEGREDIRTGIIASAVFNSQGGKTKPSDFIPEFRDEPKDEIELNQELAHKMKMYVDQYNAYHGYTPIK